jgi:hypothetical protein
MSLKIGCLYLKTMCPFRSDIMNKLKSSHRVSSLHGVWFIAGSIILRSDFRELFSVDLDFTYLKE